jgi:hypothetical protein
LGAPSIPTLTARNYYVNVEKGPGVAMVRFDRKANLKL